MNAINKLLDEAKRKGGFESDNQLAIAIGVTRTTISFYRHEKSTPDIYVMQRIAQLTKKRLEEVAGMIESECEKNKEKREYWKEFMKRITDKAAILTILIASATNPMDVQAKTAPETVQDHMSVYYVKYSTWRVSALIFNTVFIQERT